MRKSILIKATNIMPYRNGMLDGVGRSTIELIKNILAQDSSDIDVQVYCTGLKSLFFKFYGWKIKCHRLILSLRGTSKMSFLLEPLVRKYLYSYDLFHITNNYDTVYPGEKFIVTIHDLILYRENPQLRSTFETMAEKSRAIITCSDFSKAEIINLLHVNPDKVNVIPWGINHDLFYRRKKEEVETVKIKFGITTPYFFSCSCGSKRKNPDITLEAFAEFYTKGGRGALVLVWGNCPYELKQKYEHYIKKGIIKILNGVSNEDLACLYTGALASYFISSAEGFGFPLLESFACGTPCVTCDNTSLSELGRDFAYYVSERNVEETAASMNYFSVHGKQNSDELIKYASGFDWHKTAQQYINIYKAVLNQD